MQHRISHQFKDPELLERALTHKSFANENRVSCPQRTARVPRRRRSRSRDQSIPDEKLSRFERGRPLAAARCCRERARPRLRCPGNRSWQLPAARQRRRTDRRKGQGLACSRTVLKRSSPPFISMQAMQLWKHSSSGSSKRWLKKPARPAARSITRPNSRNCAKSG